MTIFVVKMLKLTDFCIVIVIVPCLPIYYNLVSAGWTEFHLLFTAAIHFALPSGLQSHTQCQCKVNKQQICICIAGVADGPPRLGLIEIPEQMLFMLTSSPGLN